jgi:hypothetical protein
MLSKLLVAGSLTALCVVIHATSVTSAMTVYLLPPRAQ